MRYQVWSSAVCTEIVSDNLMNAGRLPWKRTEPPSYNSCFTHQFVYNYFILSFDKITWKQRLVTWKITQAINNHSIFSQPELYLLTGSFLWTGQLRGIKEYSIELSDSPRNTLFVLLSRLILCSQVPVCFWSYIISSKYLLLVSAQPPVLWVPDTLSLGVKLSEWTVALNYCRS